MINNNIITTHKKKELNLKHLKYLFGNDIPEDTLNKLQYDHISIYSITPAELADNITQKLEFYGNKILRREISKLTITEMTACIGGNVISFAKKFRTVNAIELCKERFEYLNHNLNVLKVNKNVKTIQGDSLHEIENLKLILGLNFQQNFY